MAHEKERELLVKFKEHYNKQYKSPILFVDIDNFLSTLPEEKEENNLSKIRTAVANYMASEGCSCCRDIDAHKAHEKILAELLDVELYDDGSGYDFYKYQNTYHSSK